MIKEATERRGPKQGKAGGVNGSRDRGEPPKTPSLEELLAGAKSLIAHARAPIDEKATLLGERRYLCRGDGMFWGGPSGVGKSSTFNQAAYLWACARSAFDIRPHGELRSLILQSENNDGDVTESVERLAEDLDLSEKQVRAVDANTLMLDHRNELFIGASPWEIVSRLGQVIDHGKFDLLWIDNATSYFGALRPEELPPFLYQVMDPMLYKTGAACIIGAHTPKTNYRDTSKWSEADWQYAVAGVAGVTNWAREVMIIDPISRPVFAFRASKRGYGRIGWTDEDGEPTAVRYFSHAKGKILWEPAKPEDIQEAEASKEARRRERRAKASGKLPTPTVEQVLAHVLPGAKTIRYTDLIKKLRDGGASRDGAKEAIEDAINDGALFPGKIHNPRGGPIKVVSRQPVPSP